MDDLLAEAAALWASTGAGDDLRLVGGLAVRAHLATAARLTADIDLAPMSLPVRDRVLEQLRRGGFTVGTSGGWWRAVRASAPRRIVDVADCPIVMPKTFDAVTLQGAASHLVVAGVTIAVASADDLARLKLLAGRDQDRVDLLLLAGGVTLSPVVIARAAAQDDVERAVAAGAAQARHELRSRALEAAFEEAVARSPSERELEGLHALLDGLEREGL